MKRKKFRFIEIELLESYAYDAKEQLDGSVVVTKDIEYTSHPILIIYPKDQLVEEDDSDELGSASEGQDG